jgi:mannose-6-phosphate isomerase-like protein (cupin superfamily)
MPVFTSGRGRAPSWCQMQYYDIERLDVGDVHTYGRDGAMEKLIVGAGSGLLRVAGREIAVEEGANVDIGPGDDSFAVLVVDVPMVLIRMCGAWGEECGGSGLFRGEHSDQPHDRGDAVDYEKHTNFDSHYHDCDEYWILYEGRARVVTEGRAFEVEAGDCMATGMGFHHDMAQVYQPVRAVYFETTLEGQKRRGHLWDHTHGSAQPRMERV